MQLEEDTLVDVHCHIDLFEKPEKVAAEANSFQVNTIAVTNAPSVYFFTESMGHRLDYIHAAVGIHPELVSSRKGELREMWRILERTRFVGEVGLDYRVEDVSERRDQMDAFESILDQCATYKNKILTVHSRRAARDAVSAIGPDYPGKVILHWYSGGVRDLSRAIEYGCYFSVNLTMVRSKKGQDLVTRMPRERVLTETDGPFLKVGGEIATPAHVVQVTRDLARVWELSFEEARKQVSRNFRKLLDT